MEKENELKKEEFSLLNEMEKMEITGGFGNDNDVANLALSNCKVVCQSSSVTNNIS